MKCGHVCELVVNLQQTATIRLSSHGFDCHRFLSLQKTKTKKSSSVYFVGFIEMGILWYQRVSSPSLVLSSYFAVCSHSRKVIYMLAVKTHLHKALTLYVQYAFILYIIEAFSIIYISACTRVLNSLKNWVILTVLE